MKKGILKKGENVLLRDARPSDAETYIRWMEEGEWKSFDAPWEELHDSKEKIKKRFKQLFLKGKTEPRSRAIISISEDKSIGWVNRYSENEHHPVFLVGIDICEDDYLCRGLGTEALALWIDYLFDNSEVHKIGLHTYSFNPRMNKVAEKLGFVKEGVDREIVYWNGEWLNRIRYGLLLEEWRKKDSHQLR